MEELLTRYGLKKYRINGFALKEIQGFAFTKDLANEEPDNETWKTIPSITYTDISSNVENKLKLTAHIVGTREVETLQQGKICY